MSCLDQKNFVGLRDNCGDDLIATTTGYYIDELPGVNLEVVAQGQDGVSATAQAEIQKHINLAKNIVADRVRSHLKSRYTLDSVMEQKTTGVYETQTAQASQAFNVGQNFRVRGNPNAKLYVQDVNLTVNTTGTIALKAWDLYSGEELQSQDIVIATAGIPVYASLDWMFEPKSTDLDIFIGYDATSVASYVTRLNPGWCSTCKGGAYNTKYAQVYARKNATGANPNRNTITSASGSAGLSLRWGVQCSADPLLCSMGALLAPAIWYRVGWSLNNMMRYSKRLAPEVLTFKGDHEELAAYYDDQFTASMGELLTNVNIPKNDCFKCQSATQIAVKV